ncbi:MAG: methyltransferase domain-containing protein [Patescibacteria group bacterium]
MDELIRELKKSGVLRSKRTEEALRAAPRELFLPESLRERAYGDDALPIEGGQTISQPYTVVFMLELLQADARHIVLDAGSGSGWQSALLAYLVGPSGHVHAFEIVPELCAFGTENLARLPELARRVTMHCRSATPGLPELSGTIDRIVAAAELKHVSKPSFAAKSHQCEREALAEQEPYRGIRRVRAIGLRSRNGAIAAEYEVLRHALDPVPAAWREQMKIGGIMVYPSGNSLWREKKIAADRFKKEEFPGFAFVPYMDLV